MEGFVLQRVRSVAPTLTMSHMAAIWLQRLISTVRCPQSVAALAGAPAKDAEPFLV